MHQVGSYDLASKVFQRWTVTTQAKKFLSGERGTRSLVVLILA